MTKLALSLAVGAAALLGASAVNAAPAQKQSQAPIASHSESAVQDTDMSSHRRHWRRHHYHRWGHYHRPYYRSYGYYQRPYYYNPGPAISFSFGGGPRFGHRHHYW
jgi:hypothetical protein